MPPSLPSRPLAAAGRHLLLSDPTRLAILNALRTGNRSIAELAGGTGMHRNTVRSHIHRLERAGLVELATRTIAGRGRPHHRFRLAAGGEASHQPPFIEGLLALVREGHGGGAVAAAQREGETLGRRLGGGTPGRSDGMAVRRAAEVLGRLTFEARVRRLRGGAYSIDIGHCPFWGDTVARDGDILCGFHRGLMQGLFDVSRPGRLRVTVLPLVALNPCRCEVRLEPVATTV